MHILIFILLSLATNHVFAIPEGVSTWTATGKCDRECKKQGNKATKTELVPVRKHEYVATARVIKDGKII